MVDIPMVLETSTSWDLKEWEDLHLVKQGKLSGDM